MSFPSLTNETQPTINQTRLKRQLTEQAIAAATQADWETAAELNRRILEVAPDSEAENRLAKALWELGELAAAREHYQAALALDPTNRIAERNINRLRVLLAEAGLPADAVRFHDLRHTCATLLLTKGVHPKIVSEMLGHSSIAITLDTYSHVIPGLGQAAASAMEEALGDGPASTA